ncbi:MAG: FAD binding domain-containing protein [Anaerolineae bacterium]|nr:FAD binding domain-containing protein [Anaerolineae bacterium]
MLRNLKHYKRPTKIEDAVALVHSNANAVYLGGGAWTVAQGDPSLEFVVDLQDLGLGYVKATLAEIQIGATASLQALIDHPDAGALANGLLARAAGYVQSRNLREQGSVGGTLIVADAAEPLTTALLVLDAEIRYADPVVHKAPFMSFVAYRDRLIKTRALITELRVQRPPARSATGFEVVGRSPRDKPIVCAAAYVEVEEGLPNVVRVAVGGAHAQPIRLHKTEHLLSGQFLTSDKVTQAVAPALVDLLPVADFRGSAEYRLSMAGVLARRAIMGAWQAARRIP